MHQHIVDTRFAIGQKRCLAELLQFFRVIAGKRLGEIAVGLQLRYVHAVGLNGRKYLRSQAQEHTEAAEVDVAPMIPCAIHWHGDGDFFQTAFSWTGCNDRRDK